MGENGPRAVERGAQELLTEFQQTGQEGPFAELARRYAGMVYNVALRVTHDAHDAEDATQATFLTLAVHAKTAGKIRFVGPWLKKVSHRLALDIRRSKKRRLAREQRHAEANGNGEGNGHDLPISNGLDVEELRQVLRDEIDKLPAKYRLPLILYYFGGLSPDQISRELRCNTSTLGVRLHRGRKLLAEGLQVRGVSVTAAIVAGVTAGLVDSFVKDNFIHYASHSAAQISAQGLAGPNVLSAQVLGLIRSASAAMRWNKIKSGIAIAVLLASSLAGGTELLRRAKLLDPTIFQKLNPLQWIRPLLDRLAHPVHLSSQTEPSPTDLSLPMATIPAGLPAFAMAPSAMSQPMSVGEPNWTPMSVAQPGMSASNINIAPAPQVRQFNAPLLTVDAIAPPATAAAQRQPSGTSTLPVINKPASASPAIATVQSALPLPGPLIVDSEHGNFAGNPAVAFFSSGTTRESQLIVGDVGTGSAVQTGGLLQLDDSLILGNKPGSSGSFAMAGNGSLTAPKAIVGGSGNGTLKQTDGQIAVTTPTHTGTLVIGDKSGSVGKIVKSGGTLLADHIVIGNQGKGSLDQSGGTSVFNTAQLGKDATGEGTVALSDTGVITIGVVPTPPPVTPASPGAVAMPAFAADITLPEIATLGPQQSPVVVVGGDGQGTFVIQSSGTTAINEQPGTSVDFYVRSNVQGNGTLRGSGKVNITGSLVQNGRIIADGDGKPRSLDFSSAKQISNTIDNGPNEDNGWFAEDGGSIVLPPISIKGAGIYTWGEDSYDNVIDLVNSVRFHPRNRSITGSINIALLDPDGDDAPPLPGDLPILGLWKITSTAPFDGVDLLVRYDNVLAAELGIPDTDVTLWEFDGGWKPILDDSAGIDIEHHLIWGLAGNPTYFATAPLPDVSASASPAPEPSGLALPLLAAAALMRRRRFLNVAKG